MYLPPYDTTAMLHRQQEPPRTATHSKLQRQSKICKKQRKNSSCCRNQYFFFIFITRGEHLPRGGATPQTLLYLLYIAPRVHSLRGVFLCKPKPAEHQAGRAQGRQCQSGRGSRILKMRHEKTRRKVSIKNTVKKFLFFSLFCILNMRIKKPVRQRESAMRKRGIPHDDRI